MTKLSRPQIVVIGASTGGPGTLVHLLGTLPKNFPFPILIAQHIEPAFQDGFVQWLTSVLNLPVRFAEEGDRLVAGNVYLARASKNLELTGQLMVHYSSLQSGQICFPHIDHLFSSLSQSPLKGIGLLLTGMGTDGALGLRALSDHGWRTFVQKRETCVVHGMPSAAIRLSPRHLEMTPEQMLGVLRSEAILSQRA